MAISASTWPSTRLGSALLVPRSSNEALKDDGESESARPDHAPDDHPFHSNPIPITCARRRSTVDAYLVDLVMAVGERRKKWADLRSRCEHDGISRVLPGTARSNPLTTPSEHARGPYPRPNHLPSRVRLSMCRPAGLNDAGGRGLRAWYEGAEGDGGHLGDLRRAKRTSLRQLFAVEVAARSEGVASVRGDSAAIACRAHVGPGNRVCMVCGPSREVVG